MMETMEPKTSSTKSVSSRSLPSASPKEQMNIVIVGHVDHGKSTLVGRLLADTHSLPEGKLQAVKKECERTGKPFEYAFLLDALSDEQDQGITIDTARSFFKTKKRDYIIIDAPGHIEFLKNMISGAARAEAAVLVIDAKEGVRENSRRHGYLLSMLGINQIIVCINKMDLVKGNQTLFQKIEKEYKKFLSEIGSSPPLYFIPVSALHGENLESKSSSMNWYHGPTLLEALDSFNKAPPKSDQKLRMPVQAVYKFTKQGDDRRIIAGRVESGKIKVGDKVVFYPSNKISAVKSIEAFNALKKTEISAGWSTGITLTEEIFITRGQIISHETNGPSVSTRFRANLIWLSKKPFLMEKEYKLKIHTTQEPVRILKIVKIIDASKTGSLKGKKQVNRHDVAELILETRTPIAFDTFQENEATGRFVIVDGYDIAGGGIIVSAEKDDQEDFRAEARLRDFNWIKGGVNQEARAQRLKHHAALVMFVGKAGVGKHKIARAVEKSLFESGISSYMLDGTNILLGVDADLVWIEATQRELDRRFAEVARILLDAGHVVVSTTNAIGLADFAQVQALLPNFPIMIISIDPGSQTNSASDLTLTGQEKESKVVEKISELLRKNQIIIS